VLRHGSRGCKRLFSFRICPIFWLHRSSCHNNEPRIPAVCGIHHSFLTSTLERGPHILHVPLCLTLHIYDWKQLTVFHNPRTQVEITALCCVTNVDGINRFRSAVALSETREILTVHPSVPPTSTVNTPSLHATCLLWDIIYATLYVSPCNKLQGKNMLTGMCTPPSQLPQILSTEISLSTVVTILCFFCTSVVALLWLWAVGTQCTQGNTSEWRHQIYNCALYAMSCNMARGWFINCSSSSIPKIYHVFKKVGHCRYSK
jgi:hypothetical protein